MENRNGSRGGGGRACAHNAGGGGQRPPPPALVLRALRARKTPPPRRAPLRYPAPPWPAGIRRPYGGRPGAQNGWGGHGGRRRLAAVGRPAGPPHGRQTKERSPGPKGPGPALSGRFAPSRRPPRAATFSTNAKRQQKARPHAYRGLAHETLSGKGAATASFPWAKPLPMPYGQRRLHPPRCGYRRKPTAPASARLSPCA